MKNSDILRELVLYCQDKPELDVLNKISETASITAMGLKGNLDKVYTKTFEDALKAWSNKETTPREFRSLFRRERV